MTCAFEFPCNYQSVAVENLLYTCLNLFAVTEHMVTADSVDSGLRVS